MVYFFTNNLYSWTYKIKNIQFLQSAVFYYISEGYVYKLFHSLCTEKLMFSIFSGIIMYWRNTENWETYKFFKFSLQTTCTHGLMNSYKILNIPFLLSTVFYYISEDYVYKLFHSVCSVKLCFVFFLSLPCIGGTKKTKKHTNFACFLDKQLVLMSKGIFRKPPFYIQ